jgi:hypothetical protein
MQFNIFKLMSLFHRTAQDLVANATVKDTGIVVVGVVVVWQRILREIVEVR